jgi:hypothetical protein
MRVADLAGPIINGRASLVAEGRTVVLPLGCPFGAMGFWTRHLVPEKYIAQGTASGLHLRESALDSVTVITICHETTHWWQATKRMGRVDFDATYGYQMFATAVLKGQWGHWWHAHPIEVEAERCGLAMAALDDAVIDTEAWLARYLPALR